MIIFVREYFANLFFKNIKNMHIDIIREKIADKLNNSFDFWSDALTNTNPGNYGADEWEANAQYENIFVDIPNKKFTFNDVEFSFTVRLSSSGEEGFDDDFYMTVDGHGEFDFIENQDLVVRNLVLSTFLDYTLMKRRKKSRNVYLIKF